MPDAQATLFEQRPGWPGSVVELAQELIRIPSVNPTGQPGTEHTGEAAVAHLLLERLKAIGAEVTVDEILPGRPNVVARFPSNRPGKPRLLFAPHTDTVSVVGMTIDPFGAEVREGKLWGRGASDTKGPMAAMLWALAENADLISHLSYEIWFAGLMGEEAGQQGAKALAAAEKFDFVIAGEPTGMDVVYTHKGSNQLHLVTEGKAAHASQPDRGDNAIYKMVELVRVLKAEIGPQLARHSHPVLGTSTLSVGTITGGSKTNIVPDRCEITVDIRTVPSQSDPIVWQRVKERLQRVCPGLKFESRWAAPLNTERGHSIIRLLERGGAMCVGAPWFCDAAVFAQHRVPAIAMGPGHIEQAHTEDEFILVEELEEGARRFSAFLRALK